MATLAITQIPATGLDGAAALSAASAGGDLAPITDDRCFLRVKNASGGSINVTLTAPGTDNGQARPNRVVAVAATTGDRWIPLPLNMVNPVTGGVDITYSAAASVTVGLYRA